MQSNANHILIFIDWYLPGYKAGGQIPSLANLINLIGDEYKIFVITRDRDFGNALPYSNMEPNEWVSLGKAQIYYINDKELNWKKTKQLIMEINPAVVYYNSLFSFRFTLLPLLVFKTIQTNALQILGPRGMLGQGALQQKGLKKRLFLSISKLLGLYNNIIWHASSNLEKNEIEKVFGQNQSIRVAMDIASIPTIPDITKRKYKHRNVVELFFLSRISAKKNLKYCLEVLQNIDQQYKIRFSIIGPVEDESYWYECRSIIDKMPSNIEIKILGQVNNKDIHNLLSAKYHFFFFPTLHENFGHVIAESMFAGCPVIISDQTPWRNLDNVTVTQYSVLSTQKKERSSKFLASVGWDLPLNDKQVWIEVIERCAAMDQEEYSRLSEAAYLYAKEFTNNEEVLEANRRLFE